MSSTDKQPRAPLNFDEPPHIMLIESRFHTDVADMLKQGAIAELNKIGATYEVYEVPGALEVPAAIQFSVRGLDFYTARKRFDAYVALGCVIRGETSHYDIVAGESARGLMDMATKHTLCVGNGILTVENKEQAIERADPDKMDKGGDAAYAALSMLQLKSRFGIFPRN